MEKIKQSNIVTGQKETELSEKFTKLIALLYNRYGGSSDNQRNESVCCRKAAYVIGKKAGLSYSEMARLTGKNHGTVMHHIGFHDHDVKMQTLYRLIFNEATVWFGFDDIDDHGFLLDELKRSNDTLNRYKEKYGEL